jgi:hypothetical protein
MSASGNNNIEINPLFSKKHHEEYHEETQRLIAM